MNDRPMELIATVFLCYAEVSMMITRLKINDLALTNALLRWNAGHFNWTQVKTSPVLAQCDTPIKVSQLLFKFD